MSSSCQLCLLPAEFLFKNKFKFVIVLLKMRPRIFFLRFVEKRARCLLHCNVCEPLKSQFFNLCLMWKILVILTILICFCPIFVKQKNNLPQKNVWQSIQQKIMWSSRCTLYRLVIFLTLSANTTQRMYFIWLEEQQMHW